jgi:hypothetical protein
MFGNAVFNSRITHAFPRRRTITLLAIAAVLPFAHLLTPLLLMLWIITPMIALATLDGVTKPPPYRDESGSEDSADSAPDKAEPDEDIDFAESNA